MKIVQGYFISKPVINELPRFDQCRGQGVNVVTRGRGMEGDSGLWAPNYTPQIMQGMA